MKALESLRLLARNLLAKREVGPADPIGEPADPIAEEYDDLLASLGATPPEADSMSELALKESMIADLQESLALLQPLGEELGTCERARLAALRENEELRAEIARRKEACTREKQKNARQKKRLDALRAKFEERRRVAAERWHELRRLRGERKRLERELAAARRSLAAIPPALPKEASEPSEPRAGRPGLAQLMQAGSSKVDPARGSSLEIRASSPVTDPGRIA